MFFCARRAPVRQNPSRGYGGGICIAGADFFSTADGHDRNLLMLGAQQLLENAAFNTSRLAKTGFVIPVKLRRKPSARF